MLGFHIIAMKALEKIFKSYDVSILTSISSMHMYYTMEVKVGTEETGKKELQEMFEFWCYTRFLRIPRFSQENKRIIQVIKSSHLR